MSKYFYEPHAIVPGVDTEVYHFEKFSQTPLSKCLWIFSWLVQKECQNELCLVTQKKAHHFARLYDDLQPQLHCNSIEERLLMCLELASDWFISSWELKYKDITKLPVSLSTRLKSTSDKKTTIKSPFLGARPFWKIVLNGFESIFLYIYILNSSNDTLNQPI